MEHGTEWHGVLDDGSDAPFNSDTARIDWLSNHPDKVKNLRRGVLATDIKTQAQPNLRAAIDAAMESTRRDLRVKGLSPQW